MNPLNSESGALPTAPAATEAQLSGLPPMPDATTEATPAIDAAVAEAARNVTPVNEIAPPPGGWPEVPASNAVKAGETVSYAPRVLEGASATPAELLARPVTSVTPGSVNTSPEQVAQALNQPAAEMPTVPPTPPAAA